MSLVMFMSQCAFLKVNLQHFIVEKTKATSLITCSSKCSFVGDKSVEFWYESTAMQDKRKSKLESKEFQRSKVKTPTMRSLENVKKGTCYCVSREPQHTLSAKFNFSQLCHLNKAYTKDNLGKIQGFTSRPSLHSSRNGNLKATSVKPGKLEKKAIKIPEAKHRHGKECAADSACKGKLRICWDGKCKCKPRYLTMRGTRKCVSGCRDIGDFMEVYPDLRLKNFKPKYRIPFKKPLSHKRAARRCYHRCNMKSEMCFFANLEVTSENYKCHLFIVSNNLKTLNIKKLKFSSREESHGFTFLVSKCYG